MAKHMDDEQPLIGKAYLYAVPVIVVILVLNLLFNQDARDLIGLKRDSKMSLGFLTQWVGGTAKSRLKKREIKPLTFSANDIDAFSQSFVDSKVPTIILQEPPRPVEDAKMQAATVHKGEDELGFSLWPVTIQGTFQDRDVKWNAIISGYYCKVGREISSSNTDRALYTILAIGRKSIWLAAYPPDLAKEKRPEIPTIEWPDVAMIVTERESALSTRRIPMGIRLANGAQVRKGQTLKYRNSDVQFKLKELWASMVIFEARKGDQIALLGCSLVAP